MPVDGLWLQNVDYPARLDRTLFDSLWTEGILGATSFAVSALASPAMAVQVAAGSAVIQGDDQAFQGKYLARAETVTTPLAISAAPGSGQRNDLVVLKVRDPNAGGVAGNDVVLQVVTGTASPSPVDPAVPASALVLARVRVPAGTGSIISSLIDDLRVASTDTYDTVAPGSIDLSQLVASVANALCPTGSIMPYAGASAPSGWLLCDGSAIPPSFGALIALIGANTPDLRGRFPMGKTTAGTGSTLLGIGGSVTIAETNLPAHKHAFGTLATGSAGGHAHTASTGPAGTHSHTINTTDPGHNHTQVGHNHLVNGTFTLGAHDHNNLNDYLAIGVNGSPINGSQSPNALVYTTPAINSNFTGISSSSVAVADHTHSNTVDAVGGHSHGVSGDTANTGSGTNYFQPFVAVNYIIKT